MATKSILDLIRTRQSGDPLDPNNYEDWKKIYESDIQRKLNEHFSNIESQAYKNFKEKYDLWRKDPLNDQCVFWRIRYYEIVDMMNEYWIWRNKIEPLWKEVDNGN